MTVFIGKRTRTLMPRTGIWRSTKCSTLDIRWTHRIPNLQDPCNRYYRKCYYDCSFNGQTFTDWDGDYANIPSWVPYDKTQNNNGDLHTTYQTMDYYPGYTMPGLTCTKTREGPLWRNEFERNTQGAVPSPPWPEYRFNQSRTWGCDAYSVALDTTYFLYDTPERFLLIKNASWDAMDKNLRTRRRLPANQSRNLMVGVPDQGLTTWRNSQFPS